MQASATDEIFCNHWIARVHATTGREVSIHIHRGAPIAARDARRIARQTAPFGKLASLSPLGICRKRAEDEIDL